MGTKPRLHNITKTTEKLVLTNVLQNTPCLIGGVILSGILLLGLSGCRHLPSVSVTPAVTADPYAPERFLWDLGIPGENRTGRSQASAAAFISPTQQLYSEIDFEAAFRGPNSAGTESSPSVSQAFADGEDSASWNYFSPAEFSTGSMDTLYISFRNDGSSVWDENYRISWYAGDNPTEKSEYPFAGITAPGEDLSIALPVSTNSPSWKSCWQLLNGSSRSFYEFCYSHGSGTYAGITNQPSAAGSDSVSEPASSASGWEFATISGSAPAPAGEGYSASVSLSPENGHRFKAYDHTENFSATFTNTGSTEWDPSMSLIYYNGYNWFHTNSFPLTETVAPGGSYTFTMPMEIIEDNDGWNTCWYLAAPNGGTVESFCFSYRTGS